MWGRVIPFLILIGACGVGALIVLYLAPALASRFRRGATRDSVDEINAKWAAELNRQDLARQRERLNRGLDDLFPTNGGTNDQGREPPT